LIVPVAEVWGSTSEVALLRLKDSTTLLVLEEKVTTVGGPLGLPEVKAVKLRMLPLSVIDVLDGWRSESDVAASDDFTLSLAESISLVPDPVVLELLVVVDDIGLEMLCAEVKLAACVSGMEKEPGIWVPATTPLEPEDGVATIVVLRPIPDGSLIEDEEVELFPGLVPAPAVSLVGKVPVRGVSSELPWVRGFEVALLLLTPVAICTLVEWMSWLSSGNSGSVRLWLLLLADPPLRLLPAILSGSIEPGIPEVGLLSPVPMVPWPDEGTSICAILLPRSKSGESSSAETNGSPNVDLAAIGSDSVVADSKTLTLCCSLIVILVVEMCVLMIVVESVLATRRHIKSKELHINAENRQPAVAIADVPASVVEWRSSKALGGGGGGCADHPGKGQSWLRRERSSHSRGKLRW
jgi:hypothetical protein